MKHTNKTINEMLASGQWAKIGKKAYRHVSGIEIGHDGTCWTVGGKRYHALWVAQMDAEIQAEVNQIRS